MKISVVFLKQAVTWGISNLIRHKAQVAGVKDQRRSEAVRGKGYPSCSSRFPRPAKVSLMAWCDPHANKQFTGWHRIWTVIESYSTLDFKHFKQFKALSWTNGGLEGFQGFHPFSSVTWAHCNAHLRLAAAMPQCYYALPMSLQSPQSLTSGGCSNRTPSTPSIWPHASAIAVRLVTDTISEPICESLMKLSHNFKDH